MVYTGKFYLRICLLFQQQWSKRGLYFEKLSLKRIVKMNSVMDTFLGAYRSRRSVKLHILALKMVQRRFYLNTAIEITSDNNRTGF